MKTCGHEGPLYRTVPKGQIGPWACRECIADGLYPDAPDPEPETVDLAEALDTAVRVERQET